MKRFGASIESSFDEQSLQETLAAVVARLSRHVSCAETLLRIFSIFPSSALLAAPVRRSAKVLKAAAKFEPDRAKIEQRLLSQVDRGAVQPQVRGPAPTGMNF